VLRAQLAILRAELPIRSPKAPWRNANSSGHSPSLGDDTGEPLNLDDTCGLEEKLWPIIKLRNLKVA
jgi:hypothetical protein